ncbi:hypothetical protein B0H14DRAFT_3570516 [Mycena olivaceomarginata]|nr:hypothetical protein B0H14DRAFT_3570516 [Mycena olivaceomarginata]
MIIVSPVARDPASPVHWRPLLKMKMEAGENLPEVLCCISEWCSVLEDRNTVPGGSLSDILGGIAAFEASLANTPSGFTSSFSPSSLSVSIGAFIYPGFVAGKEIETTLRCAASLSLLVQATTRTTCRPQHVLPGHHYAGHREPPFRAVPHVYLGPEEPELICHRSMTLTEATAHDEFKDISDEEVGSP